MEKTYDLIIIGSGPAGLSAAIYAQRAGLDTLVLEKEYISGGQVVNTAEVDNYPGLPGMNGYELGMKFRSHADALEAKFQIAEVKDIIIEETQKTFEIFLHKFYKKADDNQIPIVGVDFISLVLLYVKRMALKHLELMI